MKHPLILIALFLAARVSVTAADHYGRVTFGTVPVPGATVTAVQGGQQRVTVTDPQGIYRFTDIAEGVLTLRVEMVGFATISRDITIAPDSPSPTWELKLLPFEEITRGLPPPTPESNEPARAPIAGRPADGAAAAAPAGARSGFQRAQVNPSAGAAAIAPDPAPADASRDQGAADGFLINGSVNNGAASPFAQLAAFGNNRRGGRSLYNGGIGVLLGNSAWDARPFSFTGEQTPRPSYNDMQILGSFAGPLKIPGLIRNGPTLFLGYQRTVDHNASTQSALMPTALERTGNFSQTRDRFGRPAQIVDPATGVPFADNIIPPARISPQAASLLGYYPLPNRDAGGQFNYETPTLVSTHEDAMQSRFSKVLDGGRHQVFGNLAYQRTTTDASDVFAFVDSTRVSGHDTTINWSHRLSQFRSVRLRYQFTRLTTEVTPYFADRTNVSGEAGRRGAAW